MQHPNAKNWRKIAQQAARNHKQDANRAVPALDLPDGFGLMGGVDHVYDVGAAQKACAHDKQHRYDEGRKAQRKYIRGWLKNEPHLRTVHNKQAEQPPDDPGKRPAQNSAQSARAKGDARQIRKELPADLPSRCAEQQKDAGLSGFLPEKKRAGIDREHRTA